MKKGWEYKTLGEVAEFISGYTPPKELIVSQGNIPYFKVAEMNLFGNELYLTRTNLYVERTNRIIPQGSIVFPKNGGAIFTNKKRILSQDSVVDLNTEALSPNKSYTTTEFLYYILQFIDLGSFDNGGGLPSINIRKMKGHPIPVPPLSEQEEIVLRLDKAFEQIETMRRNAEQSLTTAQQLFQSTLSHLLTPQPHWDRKTLRELCEKSVNIKWDEVSQEKTFVYIDLTAVNRETKRIEQTQQIDSINAPSRAKQIVTRGDVLFATTRPTLRRVCIVPDVFNGQICSTGFCVLRPKKDLLSEYLLFKLQEDDFYKYIEPLQTGANYPAVTDSIVKRYSIYVPPLTEQTAIVAKLDSLSAKVKQLKDNYTRTVALCDEMKQALLKEVFE